MTYLQTMVIGFIQGVAELFPVSSLGHTVVIPALIGGSWARLVTEEASPDSPYLAFVVGLHVATALALIVLFRKDWARIIKAFFSSVVSRRVDGPDAKLSWLIVVATIPVGLIGVVLEHRLRVLFAKPLAASIFLTVNGAILFAGERLRRRAVRREQGAPPGLTRREILPRGVGDSIDDTAARRIGFSDAVAIGVAQSAALLAGISRDGICMIAGLVRGLSHEEAARFALLLSAPPILLAGLLKVPDLLGPLGNGIRGQVLAGSAVAFVTAYLAARLLLRWFRSGTLLPFSLYCLAFGGACVIYFAA